jgi:hypothetical protein
LISWFVCLHLETKVAKMKSLLKKQTLETSPSCFNLRFRLSFSLFAVMISSSLLFFSVSFGFKVNLVSRGKNLKLEVCFPLIVYSIKTCHFLHTTTIS